MSRSKIAITIDESTLERLDELVQQSMFPSRGQAIQEAVEEKLARLKRSRPARECAKPDPAFEKSLAEEGLSEDLSGWPGLFRDLTKSSDRNE
jgi:Arc/MetJ-type ribon-helix-helix transcriptional regulator